MNIQSNCQNIHFILKPWFISVTIEDVLDHDVEADKKRIKERCLPVDSPLLYKHITDDVHDPNVLLAHPVGGTGEGQYCSLITQGTT